MSEATMLPPAGKTVVPAHPRHPRRPRRKRNYARWRAISLSLVYLVFAAHIVHWKLAGKTLAPLELNEVMYTLELGIVTAGFLFMCCLALGTLAFGRFFCSWACHIMVLQDLCAWLLRKLGIRRKPIRSRLLLLVPGLTALYMFVWPQILRAWHSRAWPTFHLRSDAEGWASFVTHNFWRNLPSPPVIVLTFLVCGFLIVYLLGSRSFCTYVCPYGAIFGLADRFSPGKIRLVDTCRQCGSCTAACTSGVRVHEEIRMHQRVVSSACLKDLDCVSACPEQALGYGLGQPSIFAARASGGRFGRQPYEFSWREELSMGVVFLAVLLVFRGLYSRVPFLLSLALGAIVAYLTIKTARLATRREQRLANLRLKSGGRLTATGWAYAACMVVLGTFILHSAFVRYHEYSGLRGAIACAAEVDPARRSALAGPARARLLVADRWGLVRNERVERAMIAIAADLGRPEELALYASRVLDRHPHDAPVRLQLAQALARHGRPADAERELGAVVEDVAQGRVPDAHDAARAYRALGQLRAERGDFAGAETALRRGVELDPERAAAQAALGSVLAEMGRLEEAVARLREAVRLDPDLADAHYNLGTLLAHRGSFVEAIPSYERALAAGLDDAELHNNLGFALLRLERLGPARGHLERALALAPRHAAAHFNLGVLEDAAGNRAAAGRQFRAAAELDPRFARALAASPTSPR